MGSEKQHAKKATIFSNKIEIPSFSMCHFLFECRLVSADMTLFGIVIRISSSFHSVTLSLSLPLSFYLTMMKCDKHSKASNELSSSKCICYLKLRWRQKKSTVDVRRKWKKRCFACREHIQFLPQHLSPFSTNCNHGYSANRRTHTQVLPHVTKICAANGGVQRRRQTATETEKIEFCVYVC